MKNLVLLFAVAAFAVPIGATGIPEIDGWSPAGEVAAYDAESLWEFINGAAETFMQYGFQGLETVELERDGTLVAVSIYDMGSPINAYGIYRTELPDDVEPLAIGAQAIVSAPYQALLAKDRFYVKIDVYDGEIDDAGGRAILETIAGSLPGSNGMPEQFGALPADGRVAGSERYTRDAFLGLRELSRCASAEYEGGRTIFAVLPAEGSSVEATWKSLASKWKSLSSADQEILTKTVPYTGVVGVTRKADAIYGVVGAGNEAEVVEQLQKLP